MLKRDTKKTFNLKVLSKERKKLKMISKILAALSAYYLWKRKLQNKETARFLHVPEELRLSGKGMEDADLSMEEK